MPDALFSTYLLPAVLAFIMFGMGLSLTTQDFRLIGLHPKGVFLGLISQLGLLPLFALLVAYGAGLVGLPPEFQVGLVLVAACPGGAVSNLISYLLKANVALSVAITSLNSLLVVFTAPSIIRGALWLFMPQTDKALSLPFWETVGQIVLITVFPCVLGLYIRAWRANWALAIEPRLRVLMPLMLAGAMLGAIFLEKSGGPSLQMSSYAELSFFVLVLNVGGMYLGYYLAKIAHLKRNDCLTIGIEVGLQNTGLAITIATSRLFLDNPTMAIPASIYALFTFATAIGFGLAVKPSLWNKMKFNTLISRSITKPKPSSKNS
ncbi:MAG: bile acid:sodium symporter family protein [Microscillaceae bacterium]